MKPIRVIIFSLTLGAILFTALNYFNFNLSTINYSQRALDSWRYVGFNDEINNLPDQSKLIEDIYKKENPSKAKYYSRYEAVKYIRNNSHHYSEEDYGKMVLYSKESQMIGQGFPFISTLKIVGIKCCQEPKVISNKLMEVLNLIILILFAFILYIVLYNIKLFFAVSTLIILITSYIIGFVGGSDGYEEFFALVFLYPIGLLLTLIPIWRYRRKYHKNIISTRWLMVILLTPLIIFVLKLFIL